MNEIDFVKLLKKTLSHKGNDLLKMGIGDDCAIIKGPNKIDYLITGDSINERVHFLSDETLDMIISKLFVRNISDIYAMGGKPLFALLFTSMKRKETENILSIVNKYAFKYGVTIIGGDFNYSVPKRLTMVIIGQNNRYIYKRSNAKPGDFVYISGYLGLPYFGLQAIKIKDNNFSFLIKKYHYFSLPTKKFLSKFINNKNINAAIDISDGLLKDGLRISNDSNVKIVIQSKKIPIHKEIKKFCDKYNIDPLTGILSGGDDYQLLFTSTKKLDFGYRIGYVERGKGFFLDKKEIKKGGYDFFQ